MAFKHKWLCPRECAELQVRSDEDLMALIRAKSHDVQSVACRILRDSHEAEDSVQSVFLEIFECRPDLQGHY